MTKTIALVGNPNSGKTTLFNALTGANQTVGNWPGVTVEKKLGQLKEDATIILQDLPGVYSLTPYSPEEIITRDYLLEQKPDLILNIIDGTNLERNLYLTLQLMETGLPIVLAINMLDLIKKEKRTINLQKISYLLGIPVIGISALKKQNLTNLKHIITKAPTTYAYPKYDNRLESALTMIQAQLPPMTNYLRWQTIKLFEGETFPQLKLTSAQQQEISAIIQTAQQIFDDTATGIIVNARYDYIAKITAMCVIDQTDFQLSLSDRIDRIVTNRWLALPIFTLVMWLVYYLSVQTIGAKGSDWLNDVLFGKWLPDLLTQILVHWQVAAWMQGLLIDGILAGVGSVLGFVPQIALLFLCLSILEDCGYMARIAFVMDRIFHRFNLSGKSFIPILISTGCGVPGIMATRTIETPKDRKMTIMLTTFMPCSAKFTVIALIAGTFFNGSSLVALSAYFLGIAAVIFSGIFLKKTKLFAGATQPFIMELPAYHLPQVNNICLNVFNRTKSFIDKAGTIIFASCVSIWLLSNFNFSFEMVDQNHSILKTLGTILAPIFRPLGFGDWQMTIACLTGLIAKENCVSTLNIAYGGLKGLAFHQLLAANYSTVQGYAFLAFNLLCAPCFAAIGAMYREFGNLKWTLISLGYQCGLAYIVALLIYQTSLVFTNQATLFNYLGLSFALICLIWALLKKTPTINSEE